MPDELYWTLMNTYINVRLDYDQLPTWNKFFDVRNAEAELAAHARSIDMDPIAFALSVRGTYDVARRWCRVTTCPAPKPEDVS